MKRVILLFIALISSVHCFYNDSQVLSPTLKPSQLSISKTPELLSEPTEFLVNTVDSSSITLQISNYVEECPICYEPIPVENYYKSFACNHTTFHQQCAQSWVDNVEVQPRCPLCRADTLLVLTPRESNPRMRLSSPINICTNPNITEIRTIAMLRSIQINDFSSAFTNQANCIFSPAAILDFCHAALTLNRWLILVRLLTQHGNFEFEELSFIYNRTQKIKNIFYDRLMLLIIQRTKVFSMTALILENKNCILKEDKRCIGIFLRWYHRAFYSIPMDLELTMELNRYIVKNPLSIRDIAMFIDLPRSFISEDTLGSLLLAYHNQIIQSDKYAHAFLSIVDLDIRIPAVYMNRILHNYIVFKFKKDLDFVLRYRYFDRGAIEREIEYILNKKGWNKLVSFKKWDKRVVDRLARYLVEE